MKLYDYFRSSASYRVRIGLALKHIAFEEQMVDLRTGAQNAPAYKAVVASGLVPALVTDDGTVLSQSLAILRYLDRLQPAPLLFPADPQQEAHALEMALTIACDIHPLNNLRVLHYLQNEFKLDQNTKDAWYSHWVQTGFATLEVLVGQHGDAFCLGNSLSIADVFLAPQMLNARRFKVDVAAFPKLVEIDARLIELEAFKAAMPDE